MKKMDGMLEAFLVDVNGALRGKWIPPETAEKVFTSGLRMPYSLFAVDIWGQDVLPAGLVTETGDSDGLCRADKEAVRPVPWLDRPVNQVLLSMYDEKGAPFFADPRHVLSRVLALYKKAKLTPVVAAELEFYLLDAKSDEKLRPQPPLSPASGRRVSSAQILGLGEADDFRPVLTGIADACRAQNIPADTTISENGPAQFEINLYHAPDALAAADNAVMLKRAVKGVAQKHSMTATFMAKPYANQSGNGLHIHFSILDAKDRNIFAGKDKKGAPNLRHAIAGLLAAMPYSMAVLAPNLNSYRRFRTGSHAPTKAAWGYDNRSCALRVPASDIAATRIEYRVPGADANPYLVLALVLYAAFDGIKKKKQPPPAIKGNAYHSAAKALPDTWEAALDLFARSKFVTAALGEKYKKLYLACKAQERETLLATVSSAEHDAYLRDV